MSRANEWSAIVYEWDTEIPSCVRMSFQPDPWNGRHPDRSYPVWKHKAAPPDDLLAALKDILDNDGSDGHYDATLLSIARKAARAAIARHS